MKILLWSAAVGLGLFSALHVFVTYDHWHQVGRVHASVVIPALVAVLAAGLAFWLARRASRVKPSA
ncbi:MAG TPA: hypothetical protein VF166_06035 [Gemmatimonadaceae bacterium]